MYSIQNSTIYLEKNMVLCIMCYVKNISMATYKHKLVANAFNTKRN